MEQIASEPVQEKSKSKDGAIDCGMAKTASQIIVKRGFSSVGRACASHAQGRWFDSCILQRNILHCGFVLFCRKTNREDMFNVSKLLTTSSVCVCICSLVYCSLVSEQLEWIMHSCFASSARNIFRTINYTNGEDVYSLLAPCLLSPHVSCLL
jgi:hypothetical protein